MPRPSAPTPPRDPLSALQERLGYQFQRPALLQRALTHRSFGAEHNERLEFLGDTVLGLAVSTLLFERFGASDEGDLSRVRASLVRQDSLHRMALGLALPVVVRLGDGELRSGGAQRPSILADAFEAVLGAVYLDGGYLPAEAIVRQLFDPVLQQSDWRTLGKDAKTELQEWLQARKLPVPTYRIVATHGEAHRQRFDVACEVPALQASAQGTGASRRAAEQVAARVLLDRLREQDPPAA